MRQTITTLACLLLSMSLAFAQNATIKGTITDSRSKETMIGVSVTLTPEIGTNTNVEGQYELEVPPGRYTITYSFIGYKDFPKEMNLSAGEVYTYDIKMTEGAEQLGLVVVSGSKFEREISEETVSIEVVKSDLLENTNAINLADGVDKVAGVLIADNQANIRGGSGYAFGAGSRVLLLYDDLPMLTVDRGEIRWTTLPIEITEQVEVIKSASSALYGSSALNGVINLRTAYPTDVPHTEAIAFYNGYGAPKNATGAWWNRDNNITTPARYGGSIVHKRRVGDFDFVMGFSMNKTIGYVRLLDYEHIRFSGKFRHRVKKIKGLSYGVNTLLMASEEGDYFFWRDAEDGILIPFGSTGGGDKGTLSLQRRKNILVDPWLLYIDKAGSRHSFRFRYNFVNSKFTASNLHPMMYYSEYQFQRRFPIGFNLVAGASSQYYTLDDIWDLGTRSGHTGAFFAQLDYSIPNKVNANVGIRYETFNLDGDVKAQRPVTSFGVNYQPGKSTYIRTSFGQGFRFPSLAERFVDNGVSGINIFPNPGLVPEYGINAEFGVKQRVKIGEWNAYFDVSLFWMEYWDMIEFLFGIYLPDDAPADAQPLDYLGFRSENVGRTRIAGYEVSVFSEGKLGKIPVRWQGGYTYNYPVSLNEDSTLAEFGNYMGLFFKSIASRSDEVTEHMLKYRSRHLVKSDIEVDLKKVTLGLDMRYYGFIEKLDPIFEAFIPGLEEFRDENDKGSFLMNVRIAYDFDKFGRISFIINNILNQEISVRPARLEPPRNFVVQYKVNIGG